LATVPLVVRLVVGVVLASAVVLAPAAGAAGSTAYEDERAEEAGAPDIQRVTVSNDDAGRIAFRVEIPTHPTLTRDLRLRLWFSDGHPATGLTDTGADGFVLVDGFLLDQGTAALYRCQDSVCIPTAYSTGSSLGFTYASGMAVTTGIGALGVRLAVSPRLEFWVEVGAGYAYDPATRLFDLANVRRDIAPSAVGSRWTYVVRIGPSALVARSLTTTPTRPRAGERLTLRMHVVSEDTGRTITSGEVSCAARIGGSRLRAVSSRFGSGRATCAYRIPARASGKTLRASISVTLAGKTVTRSFTRAIR
jgi:hypothetical protein